MNAIQCDQCHAFAPNPNPKNGPREWVRRVPDGWVSMAAGHDETNDAQGEFCSMRCAGLFLLAWAPAELTEAERLASRKVFGLRDETGTLIT